MSQIQTLIADYYQNVRENQKQEVEERTAEAVIEALRTQETLFAAWFPKSNHYFMTMEFGQPCTVLFSDREIFERFAVHCKEQGIRTAAIQNPVKERVLLFADLWRCGFTRVMVDFEPLYLNISLFDLFTPPDYSNVPLIQRPVISPQMTGYVLRMVQDMETGQAHGNTELQMLSELYHSPFFSPVEPQTGRYLIGTSKDKRFAMLFTDRREWAATMKAFVPKIVRYADIKQLLEKECDGVILNPGTGAQLYLDAQLLETAEKVATGETEHLTPRAMQEMKVTISDPEPQPSELIHSITAILQKYSGVKTAWLRSITKSDNLHAGYLLVYACTPETDQSKLFRELKDVAMPMTDGKNLEYMAFEELPDPSWAGNTPFYHKKRFGFLR